MSDTRAKCEELAPDPRQWLISGGGGHEDGSDGLRASIVSGEGLVDFLEAYREATVAAFLPEMERLVSALEGLASEWESIPIPPENPRPDYPVDSQSWARVAIGNMHHCAKELRAALDGLGKREGENSAK